MKSGLVSIKKLQTNAWLNLLAETPEESYLNNPYSSTGEFLRF
jgi:hypothetical protein